MTGLMDNRLDHACPIQISAGGLISADWCLRSFAATIERFQADLTPADIASSGLLLHEEGPLQVYYAPFDRLNPTARVVLVGITPGKHQMLLALNTARRALGRGQNAEEALRQVDAHASFAGPMRTNLVQMLDGIGLADALEIGTTAMLFGEHQHLAATASVISYPVFRNGENYSGSSPRISNSPILRAFATQMLAARLAAAQDALVIPLGKYAAEGVQLCIDAGVVDEERCLSAFPHPSGQNGHRQRLYRENFIALATQIEAWAGRPVRRAEVPEQRQPEPTFGTDRSHSTANMRRRRRAVPPAGLVVPAGSRWCPWGDDGHAFPDGRGHLVPIEGFGRGNGSEHGATYCSACKRARWGHRTR